MKISKRLCYFGFFLLTPMFSFMATAVENPLGTLVIVGGGERPESVMNAFVEASGGRKSIICFIPTSTEEPIESLADLKPSIDKYSAPIKTLEVHHREDSSLQSVLDLAKTCTGFWFSGGDQIRVNEAIVGTPLQTLLLEKYNQGATIGGTSAGAAIMSKIMLTGEDRDGKYNLEMIGHSAYKTREGMGFLPANIVVDQHFLKRNRQNRMLSVLMDHPEALVGFGIDEETALVIKDHKAKVLGNRKVMIFDTRKMKLANEGFKEMKLHLISQGQGYDLLKKQVID